MFSKKQFGLVFGALLSFFIGLVLTFYILIAYAGGVTLNGFLTGIIKNYCVGFTLASLIPLGAIGDGFAKKFGVTPDKKVAYNLVSNIPTMVLMGILMNFLLWYLFFETGEFLPMFVQTLPAIILVAYIAGVVSTPISAALAGALCTKE